MGLKEGMEVRMGEEAYKIVKSAPKFDKMSGQTSKDQNVELFGKWQIEKYIPPPAENGIIPRNEYGNVELFRPWMLPKNTIHIPIPNLSIVAKKLGIDCAPAMVGWEFISGSMKPMYDGVVVCEDTKDFLMDAWNQEIDEQAEKRKAKKEKRALDNWKKLVRGLLLYNRIAKKYAKK